MCILLFFIAGILFIIQGRKKEAFEEKLLMYGSASPCFGQGIFHITIYIHFFYLEGTYSGHTFYGVWTQLSLTSSISIFGVISWFIGTGLFLFSFDKVLKDTRYLSTILNFIFMVFGLLLSLISPNLTLIFMWIVLLMMFIACIRLCEKSSKEFEAVAAFLIIGLMIIYLANFFNNRYILSYYALPLILAPVLFMLGIFVIILIPFIDPHFFRSKPSIHWTITLIVGTISILVSLFLALTYSDLSYFSMYIMNIIITIIPLIYGIYRIFKLKTLKSQHFIEKTIDKEIGDGNLIKSYIKPQKLTEEEVAISKEKKICIVCKGKVFGMTFICPECETFYCAKCSEAIIKLENVCWACNAPIDKSKPSKPNEKERDGGFEVEVSEIPQKAPKNRDKK